MTPEILYYHCREFRVPPVYWDNRLTNYQPRTEPQEKALVTAKDFVADFRNRFVPRQRKPGDMPEDKSRIGKGLLFLGPPGSGKTTLAVATMLEVIHQHPGLLYGKNGRTEHRLLFLSSADYIKTLIRSFSSDGNEEFDEDLIWEAESAAVAVLDDVGHEYRGESGYAENQIEALLRHRFHASCPTILTTNLDRSSWGNAYSASMVSFARGAFTAVPMSGDDLR